MLSTEILSRFRDLVDRANALPMREPMAVTLATVDGEGRVSARVVLLREFDEWGFVFYTNSLSRKGEDMAANANVALCFHWEQLGAQVRIEGTAAMVSDDEADAYWTSRPRVSQIGGWASLQSQPLDDRQQLVDRVQDYEALFADRDVLRPAHWTGYRVAPRRIEFWKDGEARLHHRDVYEATENSWTKQTLFP
jgi:pyridoxamine 5'-phosphate oxidase